MTPATTSPPATSANKIIVRIIRGFSEEGFLLSFADIDRFEFVFDGRESSRTL